jgi:hypothetical protein
MKTLMTATLAFLGLAAAAEAQETMEQKRDKKLQSPFLKKAAWITDYDAAMAEAKKSKKPIFAYFTRSYSP